MTKTNLELLGLAFLTIGCAWLGWRAASRLESARLKRLINSGLLAFFLAPSMLGFMPCPAFIVLAVGIYSTIEDPSSTGGILFIPYGLGPIAALWAIFFLIATFDSMVKSRTAASPRGGGAPRAALWSAVAAIFFAFTSQGCASANIFQTITSPALFADPGKFRFENGFLPIVYTWIFLFLLYLGARKLTEAFKPAR